MSLQPVPTVAPEDVERVVSRDFPASSVAEARRTVEEYGTEEWHREVTRVRLAALKLASGDLACLKRQVDRARSDYRDVLANAEYPEYLERVPGPGTLPAEELEQVVTRDSRQYQKWLMRTP